MKTNVVKTQKWKQGHPEISFHACCKSVRYSTCCARPHKACQFEMLLEVHFVCQLAIDIDPCQLQLSRLLLWGLLSSSLTWSIVIIRHYQMFLPYHTWKWWKQFQEKLKEKEKKMRPPVHITPYKSTSQETTLGATYLCVAKEYNLLSPWINISSTDRLFKGHLYI